MPAVSIIIPCYNVKKEYIEECIDSVLNQTFRDFEVILIDDGSVAPFAMYLEEIVTRDNRIGLFKQTNQGVSAARNYGVCLAVGEYICFIDADDRVLPNYLEQAYAIAKEKGADILYSYVYRKKTSREVMVLQGTTSITSPDTRVLIDYHLGKVFCKGDKFFLRGPWARLIKSEFAKKHMFPVGVPIGEDKLWNLVLLNDTDKRYLADTIWYIYEQRDDTVTSRYTPDIVNKMSLFYNCLDSCIIKEDILSIYYYRVFDDLKRYIFQLYLGNSENKMPFFHRWFEFNNICNSMPWCQLRSASDSFQTDIKLRIAILLLKTNLLFPALVINSKIKQIFSR